VLLLLAGIAYLCVTFHPRVRFADPSPNESLEVRQNFLCYYDMIYGQAPAPDVLFFGASKTHYAVDAKWIGEVYESIAGEHLDTFAFDTFGSNPALMYFFFRDYLAHNPAPEMAFFELTENAPNYYWSVRYINLLFADLAPAYMYLNVLRAWDVVNNQLFAISNFFRVVIRHIDRSFSKLLVADFRFVVPYGDNCQDLERGFSGLPIGDSSQRTFAGLLATEMEKLTPSMPRDEVGSRAALLETYKDKPIVKRSIKSQRRKWQKRFEKGFWRDRGELKERSLDYYHRIKALGEEYGVKVAFYYLPSLRAPKPRPENIQKLSANLGTTVYTLPYWYARVSYHHYKDGDHVEPEMRGPYAIWLAGVVHQARER